LHSIFVLPEAVPVDEFKTRWYIQFLCFSLAIIQLVWARGKRILSALPMLTALAQAGWLVLLIGLYFLVLSMLLGITFPLFAQWMIIAGLSLIVIFCEQKGGNFFKNVLKGFAGGFQIFLKSVSCFADIVSYIRLFAVGLAGTMIGAIFNQMAFGAGLGDGGFGEGGVLFVARLIAAIALVVFGHALNLALTALSVIIHGVRLNLLEYAGNHLEMEWSGYPYNPFAIRTRVSN
jgi:V/A-type H+-transporting ATPase subunit I